MTVNTAKATRRPLQFKCLGCLRAELDRIDAAHRAGTLAHTGNWTPAQVLDHCAVLWEAALDGGQPPAPFIARLFGRFMKGSLLKPEGGSMKPGFILPKDAAHLLPRAGVTMPEAMARIRKVVSRLDAGERMTHPSAWLGPMTHDEWLRLNLNHTQMHAGFITYPGAPQR